ncbi:hypothetical protein [Streptococcus lactarius]|uniref:hypothetical protein n=1 Tax=Streptococcus lactarius TaxID=684066 RepID=UPI00360BDE68
MLLAIFRDLVSKNRLFLFLTSLAFALYYHLVGAKFSTSFQVLLISTAIVTALSTFQLLYSYFSMNRVQAYYQLPLSLTRFKGSFLTVTFLLNLLERVLLLILFLGVKLDLPQSFKLVLLSLLVVFCVFYVFIQFNTRSSFLGGVLIFVTTALTVSSLWVQQVSYMILLSALLAVLIFKNEDLVAISKNDQLLVAKRRSGNYFWISLFQERYFFINFVFTLIFLILILIQDYDAPLKIIILLTMASVNTPLTTLISADKDLIDHVKSLPKSRFFYLMYYRVLLTYFLAVNLFVALLLKIVVMPDLGILFLLEVMILAVMEAFCTYLLKSISL